MDPVFTLQWPEFVVAHRLQQRLPKKDGYSVLIPLSRQEKGIDLAILKKLGGAHRTITIQIKASRTYPHPPPKRAATRRFLHYTWFRRSMCPQMLILFCFSACMRPTKAERRASPRTGIATA